MREAIKKADILIEALPYIQKFKGKTFVVKYGGSTMKSSEEVYNILEDIVFLHTVGIKPIVVHGGGHFITSALQKLGKKAVFVDGVRKTDEQTMQVVEKVLDRVNSKIVSDIEQLKAKAKGFSKLAKALRFKESLGYVGKVERIDTDPIINALSENFIPVLSPVGVDSTGHSININADDVAMATAKELCSEKLVLMTNVKGILANPEDKNSFYSTLTIKEALQLKKRNVISGGMIPKIDAAIDAIRSGVKKIHIIDGGTPRSMLLEIFTQEGVGTEIVN